MNYAFLPDLSALTILIVILLLLRRRHPQRKVDAWLVGLFFTLIEAIAHTFYTPLGMPAKSLHIVVLDCYLLAGLTFIWASADNRLSDRRRLLYLALNGLPLLVIDTLYGLHISSQILYLPVVACGLLLGVGSSMYLGRRGVLAPLQILGWSVMGVLVHRGSLREVVYWSLSCVYLVAAFNIRRRLPRNSTGGIAILTGFSIWSACFLLHPWIVHYREYADIASHVWNMQKSLITIGLLLVLLEEQIANSEWFALHDELTGLPNRRLFEERIEADLRRCQQAGKRLAVFLLDLNGFKKINDSLGHQAGDQALKQIAANMKESLEVSGTLARLGGDEFVLIASQDKERRGVDRLVATICESVERPVSIHGRTLTLTASLGVAVFPEDGYDATRLLAVADQRMYRLKKQRMKELEEFEAEINAETCAQD